MDIKLYIYSKLIKYKKNIPKFIQYSISKLIFKNPLGSIGIGTITIDDLDDKFMQYLDGVDITVSQMQLDDGGFIGKINDVESDLYYSFFATEILRIMKSLDKIDEQRLKMYILNCKNKDGGFAKKPGSRSDIVHTFYAIALLNILGEQSQITNDTISYIKSLELDAGGFISNNKKRMPTAYSTFFAVLSLSALDKLHDFDASSHITFLSGLQTTGGGFKATPKSAIPSIIESASSLFCLSIFDEIDMIDIEKANKYILGCQSENGGFRVHPISPATDLVAMHAGLQSLFVLGKIDKVNKIAAIDYILESHISNGGFKSFDDFFDAEYTYYSIYDLILLNN